MKKNILKVCILLAFIGYITVSCKDDDSIIPAERFVGQNLAVKDSCSGNNNGVFIYSIDIIKKNATTLTTHNLFGYGVSNVVELDVVNATEIAIDYKDVANRTFKGSGKKVGDELIIDVVVDFPTEGLKDDTCHTVITYE